MALLPCPRCGNTKTVGTFCKECLRQLSPLVKSIKTARLTFCSNCDRVRPHSDWKMQSLHNAIANACGAALVFGDAEIESVEFGDVVRVDSGSTNVVKRDPSGHLPGIIERKPGIKKTTMVLAVVTGKAADAGSKMYEEEYEVPLSYEVTPCPNCTKKGTAYYEGILQIRNQTPEVRAAIKEYLAQHKAKGLRLAKEVPCNSGSDYYLSDQRAVHHFAKFLHSHFGGELKISAQHFSHDVTAGKNLYRVNAFLEIPEYAKGDVIKRDEDYFFILGVSTKVRAENLRTGSRESFAYLKGIASRIPIKTTKVTRVMPVEVMHPTTYQSVQPTNSKYAPAELDVDEEVSIAIDGDHVFLIPHTAEKAAHKTTRKRHSQKRKRKDDDLIRED